MDRITKIEVYKIDIPLKTPFVIALETIECAHNVVVSIHTSKGLRGWGECSPYPALIGETQASAFVNAQFIAKAITNTEFALRQNLKSIQNCLAGNSCIKSAFDMALHDLAAQEAQMPLYRFLGGQNDRQLRTDMTIGMDTAEKMAKAAERFVSEGFDTIKIKLGSNYLTDMYRIELIRRKIGSNIALRLDANQGWDFPTAKRILNDLYQFDIEWCEAPIPKWDMNSLIKLNKESPIPIMADESLFDSKDALSHIKQNAADYFNIKLAKSGGLQEAIAIIQFAKAAGIKIQVGCFSESRLGIAALAHLCLAYPEIEFYDMDSPLMLAEDPTIGDMSYKGNGYWAVGVENGIGVQFQTDELEKYEHFKIGS
ncbi:MAG: dipeptide epimerase [Bacteroidota bacterium]